MQEVLAPVSEICHGMRLSLQNLHAKAVVQVCACMLRLIPNIFKLAKQEPGLILPEACAESVKRGLYPGLGSLVRSRLDQDLLPNRA